MLQAQAGVYSSDGWKPKSMLQRSKHRRRLCFAFFGFALGLSTLSVRADDQSRLLVAREVVKTAHIADNMRQLFPTVLNQMRPMLVQQGASDSLITDLFGRFSRRLDGEVDNFVDLAAKVYAREFSEEDLNNLLKFYTSPTGQRVIGKQPAIAQAMVAVGSQWGQNLAQEVIEEFRKDKSNPAPKL